MYGTNYENDKKKSGIFVIRLISLKKIKVLTRLLIFVAKKE